MATSPTGLILTICRKQAINTGEIWVFLECETLLGYEGMQLNLHMHAATS